MCAVVARSNTVRNQMYVGLGSYFYSWIVQLVTLSLYVMYSLFFHFARLSSAAVFFNPLLFVFPDFGKVS